MARRLIPTIMILSALLVLGGCLMDATVDANGAGVMTVKYRLTNEAQFEPTKKRFESTHVKLTSASVDKDKWGTFEIKFDDVTKLPTAPFFASATISLTDGEAGTKLLSIKQVNKNPSKLSDEMVAYFGKDVTVSVNLPGEVVKSNATTTKDKTVAWKYPMNDFVSAPEVSMNATFKPGTGKETQKTTAEGGTAEPAAKGSGQGEKENPQQPAHKSGK
jgi:hypothetical protein